MNQRVAAGPQARDGRRAGRVMARWSASMVLGAALLAAGAGAAGANTGDPGSEGSRTAEATPATAAVTALASTPATITSAPAAATLTPAAATLTPAATTPTPEAIHIDDGGVPLPETSAVGGSFPWSTSGKGTYDVVVVALGTSEGASPATAANSPGVISRVDAVWNGATAGAYRLDYRQFLTVNTPGKVCGVEDADKAIKDAVVAATANGTPRPGRTGVMVVSVPVTTCFGSAGQGWIGAGSLIIKSVHWASTDVAAGITAHEMGHNFGLEHSGDIRCASGRPAYPANQTPSWPCPMDEYGDYSAIMGANFAGALPNRVPAPQLTSLGLLTAADQLNIGAGTGEYTLAPPLSAAAGTRSLVLGSTAATITPSPGAAPVSIEYHPPAASQLDGRRRPAGVYVDAFANGRTYVYNDSGGMARFTAGQPLVVGIPVGTSLRLADGRYVEVLSAAETARVRISRPGLAGAPTGLVATPGDGQASVAFTPPASNGGSAITNYEISVNGGPWLARSPASPASPVVVGGLINGTTYQLRLRAVNASGPGTESAPVSATPAAPPVTPPVGSLFTPIEPARAVDTRNAGGPVRAGAPRLVSVALDGKVPAGATAVAFNLTATGQTASGFAVVTPGDQADGWLPNASTVNWARPGQTIANAYVVKVDAARQVKLFVGGSGTAELVLDVVGYYVPSGGGTSAVQAASREPAASAASRQPAVAAQAAGSAFVPVAPVRAYSSLTSGDGPMQGTPTGVPGAPRRVDLSGQVPAGATAVAYNLTVTGLAGSGYLSVAPAGASLPAASAINWAPTPTGPLTALANASQVGLGEGRSVSVWIGGQGAAQFLIDVVGYFVPATSGVPGATEFFAVAPVRAYDSRLAGPAGTSGLLIGGSGPRPTSGAAGGAVPSSAKAVAYNLTATGNSATGYLAVGPDAAKAPEVSSLNWSPPLQTVANGSVVQLGADRTMVTWAGARGGAGTHYLIDIAGYYAPAG